jgi:acetoin utilization protein AcuC
MYGDALARYAFPAPHPFGSHRLPAFWREMTRRGLDRRVRIVAPTACDVPTLEAFHDQAYVELVRNASDRGTGFLDAGDTPAFRGVFEAASIVVGTTIAARRSERIRSRGFCRPMSGFSRAMPLPAFGTTCVG